MSTEPIQSIELGGGAANKEVVAALADARRLSVLAVLRERDYPLSARDLAREVAAAEGNRSLRDVTETERRRVGVTLHHHHLPALETAGLVVQYRELDMVAATEHPIFERIDLASTRDRQDDAEAWRTVSALFERPRRQRVVSVLVHEDSPVALDDLAIEVAARERGTPERDLRPDEIRRVRTTLHHVDLPKLESRDVVAIDGDRETVWYRENPRLERLIDSLNPD